eukprot:GHVT01037460.1.p1 GENE.GHVT01037460.1~~GHVT01037460.1.p1  ORF type:complete len:101 (+),score=3.88 GHVT01037460.1:36-338(+)
MKRLLRLPISWRVPAVSALQLVVVGFRTIYLIGPEASSFRETWPLHRAANSFPEFSSGCQNVRALWHEVYIHLFKVHPPSAFLSLFFMFDRWRGSGGRTG